MDGKGPSIGILALQGCIDPHIEIFTALGASCRRVRTPSDLEGLSGIVLPGGESTTMLKLLARAGLTGPLAQFAKSHAVWGICAGAILIAKKVSNPDQQSFGLIDTHALRNFYGSQQDSFKEEVAIPRIGEPLKVDFIRAPKLEPLSNKVEVIGSLKEMPVAFQQGRVLATSFHAELGSDYRLHNYFLTLCKGSPAISSQQ